VPELQTHEGGRTLGKIDVGWAASDPLRQRCSRCCTLAMKNETLTEFGPANAFSMFWGGFGTSRDARNLEVLP
jgi:hypothetical protein